MYHNSTCIRFILRTGLLRLTAHVPDVTPVPLNRRAVGRFGLPTGYWTAHLTTPIHSRCYALGCTCRVFGCIGNLLHVILPHSGNYPNFLLSTNCMIKCACPLILDPKMFLQSLPIYTDLQKDLEYRRAIGRQKFRELRHAEVKRWCLGDAWGRLDIDGYGGYAWISDNARPKAHAQLQYVAIQEFSWVIWCARESFESLEHVRTIKIIISPEVNHLQTWRWWAGQQGHSIKLLVVAYPFSSGFKSWSRPLFCPQQAGNHLNSLGLHRCTRIITAAIWRWAKAVFRWIRWTQEWTSDGIRNQMP